MRADHKVLVIAVDPMLAALVGTLVERVGMQAAFPEPGEIADSALARVKPIAAILVDSATSEADSELFLARASRKKIPVLVFGATAAIEQGSRWRGSNDVRAYALPEQLDGLRQHLEEISGVRPDQPRSKLLFLDTGGTRWSVYDRRSADRSTVREFVSDSGEKRVCEIPETERGLTETDALRAQLARAHQP